MQLCSFFRICFENMCSSLNGVSVFHLSIVLVLLSALLLPFPQVLSLFLYFTYLLYLLLLEISPDSYDQAMPSWALTWLAYHIVDESYEPIGFNGKTYYTTNSNLQTSFWYIVAEIPFSFPLQWHHQTHF